jgi:hypothetical protein
VGPGEICGVSSDEASERARAHLLGELRNAGGPRETRREKAACAEHELASVRSDANDEGAGGPSLEGRAAKNRSGARTDRVREPIGWREPIRAAKTDRVARTDRVAPVARTRIRGFGRRKFRHTACDAP